MRSGPWRRRLPIVACFLMVLSVLAGLPSSAQQHSPKATPSPTPSLDPDASQPPLAQEKIEAALAAGTIDYPTSLLYRAYALFGDPRLPAELAGAGSTLEDGGLADEVMLTEGQLPPAIRDALTPFFVRPTDPLSYFNRPLENANRAPSFQGAATTPANPDCQKGWLGRRSATEEIKLKVWAECDGNEAAHVAAALTFAESLWDDMTTLMGPPKPDLGNAKSGGDDAIDIYLVEYGQEVRLASITGKAAAITTSDKPYEGKASSAFMLLPRPWIGTNTFKLLTAHEFFHVLQKAHNWELAKRWNGALDAKGNRIYEGYWFYEASATWAETHFVRPLAAETHVIRFNRFQHQFAGISLQAPTPDLHKYAAYVWPFFMEQEKEAASIAAAWKAFQSVGDEDWEGADEVLDAQVSFATSFRDFAVRNYNTKLPGDPIVPLYQELDANMPTTPPREVPVFQATRRLGQSPHKIAETIPSLTAVYHTYTPASDVRQVTFRFEDLTPNEALDVDALYKIKGQPNWVRRKLDQGEKLRFCLNKKDEDLERLVLVLSNHDLKIATSIKGNYTMLPLNVPCGEYRLEGSYDVAWGDRAAGAEIDSWKFEGDFSLSKDRAPGQPVDPAAPDGWGTFSGSHGVFNPGQKGCAPARRVPWRGEISIVAMVEGETLTIIVMPVAPENGQGLPDIFNTRYDAQQFNGKVIKVPLEGGTYRWGGGILPMEMDCGGLKPASGGTFTIVKIRDDEEAAA